GDFTVINQTPRGFVARLVGESLAPQILIPPQSQTAEIGSSTYFSVVAIGFPALSYQWFFNQNTPIGGLTTNAFLELFNIQPSQTGSYLVVVTNTAGAITSAPVMLNVIPPVERRILPAVKLTGEPGSLVHLEYSDTLNPPYNWQNLFDLTLTSVPAYYFELMQPLPPERYMRVRQTAPVSVNPDCQINMVPALTLTGDLGQLMRV